MKPKHLVVNPLSTDDHRRRYVGRFESSSPGRDELAVTREHDRLG
jgi:hypothetical protein